MRSSPKKQKTKNKRTFEHAGVEKQNNDFIAHVGTVRIDGEEAAAHFGIYRKMQSQGCTHLERQNCGKFLRPCYHLQKTKGKHRNPSLSVRTLAFIEGHDRARRMD